MMLFLLLDGEINILRIGDMHFLDFGFIFRCYDAVILLPSNG